MGITAWDFLTLSFNNWIRKWPLFFNQRLNLFCLYTSTYYDRLLFCFVRGVHLTVSKIIKVFYHIAHQKRSLHPWLSQPRWLQSLVMGREKLTQRPVEKEEPWISWVGCPYLPRWVPSVPLSLRLHRRLFSRHGGVAPNMQHLRRKKSPVPLRGHHFRRPVAFLFWNMIQ